jgi:hypothetical protein
MTSLRCDTVTGGWEQDLERRFPPSHRRSSCLQILPSFVSLPDACYITELQRLHSLGFRKKMSERSTQSDDDRCYESPASGDDDSHELHEPVLKKIVPTRSDSGAVDAEDSVGELPSTSPGVASSIAARTHRRHRRRVRRTSSDSSSAETDRRTSSFGSDVVGATRRLSGADSSSYSSSSVGSFASIAPIQTQSFGTLGFSSSTELPSLESNQQHNIIVGSALPRLSKVTAAALSTSPPPYVPPKAATSRTTSSTTTQSSTSSSIKFNDKSSSTTKHDLTSSSSSSSSSETSSPNISSRERSATVIQLAPVPRYAPPSPSSASLMVRRMSNAASTKDMLFASPSKQTTTSAKQPQQDNVIIICSHALFVESSLVFRIHHCCACVFDCQMVVLCRVCLTARSASTTSCG